MTTICSIIKRGNHLVIEINFLTNCKIVFVGFSVYEESYFFVGIDNAVQKIKCIFELQCTLLCILVNLIEKSQILAILEQRNIFY